ncbi:WD repeat-containing protein 92 [Balamuthia mandrillaris]
MEEQVAVVVAEKSLTFMPYQALWMPFSPRFVVLGAFPHATGVIQVYSLLPPSASSATFSLHKEKEVEKQAGFRCGTFEASTYEERHLATGDFQGRLAIWDLEKPTVPVYTVAKAHEGIINTIDGCGGGTTTGKPSYPDERVTEQHGSGSYAPEIVTGGRDGVVALWDPRQKRKPVGKLLLTDDNNTKRDCWCVRFVNLFHDEEKEESNNQKSDRYVLCGYNDGAMCFWDLRKNSILWHNQQQSSKNNKGICSIDFYHNTNINAKANAKKGAKVLASTEDNDCFVYDVGSVFFGEEAGRSSDQTSTTDNMQTFNTQQGTVWCGKFFPSQQRRQEAEQELMFLTTGGDGSIAIQSMRNAEEQQHKGGMMKKQQLADQPIISFDWNRSHRGLGLFACLNTTVQVVQVVASST